MEDTSSFRAYLTYMYVLKVYLTERDIDKLVSLVTEDIYSIGTGKQEICIGKEEMRTMYKRDVATMPMPIEFSVSDYHETMAAEGVYNTYANVDMVITVGDERTHLNTRLTITFVEREGALFASLLHISVGNEEQEADEFFPVSKALSLREELLFNNEVCGVVQYRLYTDKKFYIEKINKEASRILQVENSDIICGKAYLLDETIHHDDSFVIRGRLSLEVGESSEPKEYRSVGQKGKVTWVVGYSNALEKGSDDKGSYVIMQSMVIDIDERKKAELKNQEYLVEEQLDALRRDIEITVQGLGLGFWHCEEVGEDTFLYMDDAAADVVGMTADTEPREAFEELSRNLYPDDVAAFQNYFQEIKENGRSECTYRYNHKTYGLRYVRCSGWWDGQQRKGMHIDVTDRIEKEHQYQEALEKANMTLKEALASAQQANTAKTQFLANMSHDIRTPMNAIVGMAAIAMTHLDDTERIKDCLQKITISSKHLLGIINEVLDMSKIESGKIDLQDEAFGIPDFMESILEICKPQINGKNQNLSVIIQDIEHEKVIGDCQRLQQVFTNLISNATKYTPEGGKIRLTMAEKPTNRPQIGCYEFTVEDNGYGMSKEFQKRVFEPFERAEDSRTQKVQGTGLGMTITKNIIERMNGTIQVESELNLGTKFTVTFFLKLQPQDLDLNREYFVDLPILIADDDEIACETTCTMLTEMGMKGEWVLSGDEAVKRVVVRHETGEDFYAVILDWKMLGMDGIATAREIRRNVGNDIPIIILSAFDWSDIEQEARKAGVNAFLSKPLFKSRLAYVFNTLMGKGGEDRAESALQMLEVEDFTNSRILLVEDNELNAEIAIEILKMIGISVDWAENGKVALDRIMSSGDGYYDLIFMDIQMPVMNGYDATRAIRSLGREYTSRVPIVAMSANAFAEDVQASRVAGMNGHIAKPLDFVQLRDVLKKWIVGNNSAMRG